MGGSFQNKSSGAVTCVILTSEGQIILFLQNYSHVFGSHPSHEHSRAEIFSFGEKVDELFTLYPVGICYSDLNGCFLAAYLPTKKYLVVLGFGGALPVFKGEQQEKHTKKGKLFFFPLRK